MKKEKTTLDIKLLKNSIETVLPRTKQNTQVYEMCAFRRQEKSPLS